MDRPSASSSRYQLTGSSRLAARRSLAAGGRATAIRAGTPSGAYIRFASSVTRPRMIFRLGLPALALHSSPMRVVVPGNVASRASFTSMHAMIIWDILSPFYFGNTQGMVLTKTTERVFVVFVSTLLGTF